VGLCADLTSKDVIDDAASVCPAALLRPGTLPEKLAERHFKEKTAGGVNAHWIITVYEREGAVGALQIAEQAFSDAKIHTCLLTLQIPFSMDDVVAFKARLEGDPDIGKLEGEPGTLPGGASARVGWFKRPGNNPTFYVNVTGTDRFVTINMARTDFVTVK
jgi:hypothetical protein